jgi:hypothetical protein
LKIINVNSPDTGGQCYRLSTAINETYKGIHESRAFVGGVTYRKYPTDVLWNNSFSKSMPTWITTYWATADIIHAHAFWRRTRRWPKVNPKAGKILHQHGRFGSHTTPKMLQTQDRKNKAIRVVSSFNLLRYVNGNIDRWFPIPINLKMTRRIQRQCRDEHESVRIVHSPTNRGLKHTDLFIRTCKQLRRRYPSVQVVLIENKPWIECLKIRSNCDICFDQLLLQYGSSGLESMVFGHPVVAGCSDKIAEMIVDKIGYLPFVRATPKTLFNVLEQLIVDIELRKKYGAIGRQYVKQWHSHETVAKIAIKTYEEAINM